MAGLLFPWLGAPTWAASQGTGLLGATPSELTTEPPAGNTVVLAANGEPITWFYDENRSPVTSDQIAPVMKQAMVAIEDSRFYEHHGVDVQGTVRALVTNLAAGGVHEDSATPNERARSFTRRASSAASGSSRRRSSPSSASMCRSWRAGQASARRPASSRPRSSARRLRTCPSSRIPVLPSQAR